MHLRPIQIEVNRTLIFDFKRLAKDAFPCEAFAYLLGRNMGDIVEVEDLWAPFDMSEWSTPQSIDISPDWLPAARKAAKEQGLLVVGDIHSHPYLAHEGGNLKGHCAPSRTDLEQGLIWPVNGICTVVESKQSKRLRSSITFWGPMFPAHTCVKPF